MFLTGLLLGGAISNLSLPDAFPKLPDTYTVRAVVAGLVATRIIAHPTCPAKLIFQAADRQP